MTKHFKNAFYGCSAVLLAGALSASPGVMAETRAYAINFNQVATYRDESSCPNGDNGGSKGLAERSLKLRGYSQAEIQDFFDLLKKGTEGRVELYNVVQKRGQKNGEPAYVNHYPDSVPYQKLNTVVGPYAYGFDLDGKGPDTPNSFQDPETQQQGVDNQLYRAVGCYSEFNVNYPARPWFAEQSGSDLMVQTKSPAWIFTVTTADFNKDGEATVSFYQSIGHLRLNQSRVALANMTYVVNEDSGSFGTFRGNIKDGVFTSIPDNVHLILNGGFPNYFRLELSQAQFRVDLNKQNSQVAYLGGYQPWMDYWFFFAIVGYGDSGELYHSLRHLADAEPDAKTGENTAISTTLRIDAVPAFLARQDGSYITTGS